MCYVWPLADCRVQRDKENPSHNLCGELELFSKASTKEGRSTGAAVSGIAK